LALADWLEELAILETPRSPLESALACQLNSVIEGCMFRLAPSTRA